MGTGVSEVFRWLVDRDIGSSLLKSVKDLGNPRSPLWDTVDPLEGKDVAASKGFCDRTGLALTRA